MAKGLGLIGNYSGKVGNTIGYVLSNSNNKQTQGIRIYQPVVRNPQTALQMSQRIKTAAVSNLYRQFRDVVRRSIEGQEYGDASRRAWLRRALGSEFNAGPWVVKGTTQAWPIPSVPMSVGSLPDLNVQVMPQANNVTLEINRGTSTAIAAVTTVGELSQYLLFERNVEEGDQITILACRHDGARAVFAPVHSFYVDPAAITPLVDVGISAGNFAVESSSTALNFVLPNGGHAEAVCLIVSRDGSDGRHLRSTASWVFSTSFGALSVYNGLTKPDAIASYINQSSTTEDWQVTRSGGGSAGSIDVRSRAGVNVRLVSLTSGGNVLQAVADDGAQYFILNNYSRSNNYNKYVVSATAISDTAPAGATSANTIQVYTDGLLGDEDEQAVAFADWFVRNGGSAAVILR